MTLVMPRIGQRSKQIDEVPSLARKLLAALAGIVREFDSTTFG
jgi:hypothetical protein